VQLPDALASDLEQLTAALEAAPRHRLELSRSLRSLAQDAGKAVSSYLGLSITVTIDGHDVTMTSLTDMVEPRDISSSLRVPLESFVPHLNGTVVFYASRPDAFVELATDLGTEVAGAGDAGVEAGPEPLVSGVTGARELSSVHRAIGVLMDRGFLPEDAHRELVDRSQREGVAVLVVAERLLSEAMRSTPQD